MTLESSRLGPNVPLPAAEQAAAQERPDEIGAMGRAVVATPATTRPAQGNARLPAAPRSFQLLAIAASALLLAATIFVVLDRREEAQEALYRARSAELQMLSQRIAAYSPRAAAGEAQAFEVLHACGQRFAAALGTLGAVETDSAAQGAALEALRTRWLGAGAQLQTVLAQRSAIVELGARQKSLAADAQRVEMLWQRVSAAAEDASPAQTATTPLRQLASSMAIGRAAQTALRANVRDADALRRLVEHAETMQAGVRALLSERPGADGHESVAALRDALVPYAEAIERISALLPALTQAQAAARTLVDATDPLFEDAARLVARDVQRERAPSHYIWAALMAAGLAFVCLLWIGKVVLDDAEQRAAENLRNATRDRQANQRTQQAILRLLDEISTLAQGDLTVRASVSDEATGAIADAINYAVGELRRLVAGMNAAATRLAEACAEAQTNSGELLNASQRQSQEIATTSASLAAVTASVMQVSDRAAESTRVAGVSLAAAAEGSGSVRRSVAGMESIRSQMQQTAKRIKRLGESSQEIGEIVDLISDITQRTEVLAVNAAIQANAGSSTGRSFGPVAEEVQRLAARSAQAAQQLNAVVKAIQADTQDATSAMERSTERVVEQTGLAYAAGEALARIEQVSRELARLIAAISLATREQRDASERIHAAMRDILRITELTTDGTRRSADRSAQLAGLARELKQSVAGFKVSRPS
ncbi:MAG: methyl-accepting chemotaxis protein [Betaproteobacteria bacterium]|nr:methyl-accepting chemotaxis protein [Betaproteobacteria bacterium]